MEVLPLISQLVRLAGAPQVSAQALMVPGAGRIALSVPYDTATNIYFDTLAHCRLKIISHNASIEPTMNGTVATFDQEGLVTFEDLIFHAPMRTSMTVQADCVGATQLAPLVRHIVTSDIQIDWEQKPRDFLLSSSKSKMSVIDPPVKLVVRDRHHGGHFLTNTTSSTIVGDFTTRCVATVHVIGGEMTVVDSTLPFPLSTDATSVANVKQAQTTLESVSARNSALNPMYPIKKQIDPAQSVVDWAVNPLVEGVMRAGRLTFASLAVSGDFGADIQLKFSCYWGGTGERLNVLLHNATIEDLTAIWMKD